MPEYPNVRPPGPLFADVPFEDLARAFEQRIQDVVNGYDAEQLVMQPMDALLNYFTELVEIPRLAIHVDQRQAFPPEEISYSMPGNTLYYEPPREVTETRIRVVIPYSGPEYLLGINPRRPGAGPTAGIGLDQLMFVYDQPQVDPAQLRAKIDADIERLTTWVNSLNEMIDQFNKVRLHQIAGRRLSERRERLMTARQAMEDIGLPIVVRADAGQVHIPEIRRRVQVPAPISTAPNPVLDNETYEAILSTIFNARNALERSPSTWVGFDEEDIRNVLLLFLNGTFEGQASGEVFNGAGKTDILIRSDDRNVFIAECKFWRGPKSCTEAVDQLLSYLVWRDTKAALFMFVTNRDVSSVIDKAIDELSNHDHCKSVLTATRREDRQDFIFTAKEDERQEIHLALLIFILPRD